MSPETSLLWRIAAVALSTVVSLGATAGDQKEFADDDATIRACTFEYSELGSISRFRVTMRYQLTTGEDGGVRELHAHEDNQRASAFIVADSVTSCLRTWRLRPNSSYDLSIIHGGGEDTVYDLGGSTERRLRLLVPC